MKKFALIGAAGYIAPKHMKAIKETGNSLVAALDISDSVGILDSYFQGTDFFTEFERFDRFIDKYHRENGKRVEYISICSPNYLHDSHIRFALKSSADVICEKPLALNTWNADQLKFIEQETGRNINNILQLRLHPAIVKLKEKAQKELKQNPNKIYNIDLTYITSRGNWYFNSWKGDISKSGGIATNIGIHFFDVLCYIFGKVKENVVHILKADTASGYLELQNAKVRWFLSINYDYLPNRIKEKDQRTYRSMLIDDEEIEFSDGFADLHTKSYEEILGGNGFGLDEALGSIDIVSTIRNLTPIGLKNEYHPFGVKVKN